MLETISIPQDLSIALQGEPRDFVVKSAREQPARNAYFFLGFGAFRLLFDSIFFFAFLGPVFMGREVEFLVNDVPTVAGPGNLAPLLIPGIMISVFLLIGLGIVRYGIHMMRKKGSYFVGTSTRLLQRSPKQMRSIDRDQFSGDIKVTGDSQKGTIELVMVTGSLVGKNKRYSPDKIYMVDIPQVYEIEKLCRKRIEEHDPQ